MDLLGYVEQASQASGTLAASATFIALYIVASVLLVPASALTLGAGYLFGPLLGTAIVSAASTAGAGASFLLSRTLARPLVQSRLEGNERFEAVNKAVAAKGPQVVLLLRLSPLFPFGLLNYGLGLSQVRPLPAFTVHCLQSKERGGRGCVAMGLVIGCDDPLPPALPPLGGSQVDFWPYLGASWAGMLPGTFAYVYLGSLGKATVDAATGGAEEAQSIKLVLYAVGAIATLAATKVVSSAASRALEDAKESK